jgi:sec-independent protein translocase protein TatA
MLNEMLLGLTTDCSILALYFGWGWEVVLIFAVILILFGAKKLPEIGRGLGEGFSQFRKRVGGLSKELDQQAHDAGESLGGIYGKPAAQALTPYNQVAELYDPAVFRKQDKTSRATKRIKFRRLGRLFRLVCGIVVKRLKLPPR